MTVIAFLDLETVHVKVPRRGHAVWEIGLILRDLDALPDDPAQGRDAEYLWQMRPDLTGADPMALKIGGYYRRNMVGNAPSGSARTCRWPAWDEPVSKDVYVLDLAHYIAWALDGAHLIGANVGSFDARHLDAFLRANGQCGTWDYHSADIGSMVRGYALARGLGPVPWPLKVSEAARLLGVDPGKYSVHEALDDARMVRDCYDVMASGGGPR